MTMGGEVHCKVGQAMGEPDIRAARQTDPGKDNPTNNKTIKAITPKASPISV